MPSFCVSTSTPGYSIEIGGIPVTDTNSNPYFATTTCPAVIETIEYVTTNPSQDLFNGIILFFCFFAFISWYFLSRYKLT